MKETETLIIGASIAGMASAACLKKKGLEYIVIEKEATAAAPWRNHYERLHLHTTKHFSCLPYKKYDPQVPKYPSRQDVVDYLDNYRNLFDIRPVFHTEAVSVKKTDGYWITETSGEIFKSKYLIVATGPYGKPKTVHFPGMESFPGPVLHSSKYKTGRDYAGQQVLVAGFGNSACEIAMDLHEQGAKPAMAVRSPVNIIPRDLLGINIVYISLLLSRLPVRLGDALTAPLLFYLYGDIRKLGLQKSRYGPFEQIQKEGKIPLLDIGTIRHIREGHIKVYDDIDVIEGQSVHFKDGQQHHFDAIVAAIGYHNGLSGFIQVDPLRFDDLKKPVGQQKYFGADGLYFCGFWIGPTGEIREISKDAKIIAANIAGEKIRRSVI